ncbi:MAG: SAM-dependent methyltransferase [Gammaproteobacteria bacterium HGW-Gammaproteobacteria-3]|nr:MAG: SAM-dependent methyltransferase [Gammaproteobacteria bacterium HGW-Gammaproteobacteria-3]
MNNPLNKLGRIGLYLTVFMTGASVMVIELLGTRLIAPFYGASLYVWCSLISVTMIALALGYFIGGRWADYRDGKGFSLILALAAVLTLLIPWMTRSVLLATDPLGLRTGAFISALVLFTPSLTLLGMVSPVAIKLATRQLQGVGASSGSLYAVSTLGSVVGTLLLGFFLFPEFGSREILAGLGIGLLILALLVALYEQQQLAVVKATGPVLLLIIVGFSLIPQIVGAGRALPAQQQLIIRSEQESLYGWVRVIDKPKAKLRFLTSDASVIGAASLIDGSNLLVYQDIVNLLPALAPGMKRALIVGQGAGHMATALHERYGIKVDTLEIDPAVAQAAVDYFGFKPSGQARVGDGRYEIRKLTGPYDLIIHDCFTGGSEPAHLLTVETLRQLRGLLSEKGLLALNFVGFLENGQNPALASVAKTLDEVFPRRQVFISEPGDDFNDFIFLTGNAPVDLEAPSLSLGQQDWLKQRQVSVNSEKGRILTDNLNALEHLQLRKAEHYRQVLVEWFGTEWLLR